ncbi:MFS transporter [Verrucomicrobiota bacterium]
MIENIKFREKFGYGLGDFASNLFWMQFVFYLNIFYTDVFGLAPSVLVAMMLFVRIWDSVNDPLVGLLADRTQSRWGKFRPYLLWGAIPFAVVGILTFSTPDFSPSGKLAYAYITYALMVLVYTVVNIPYSSLMGVVSAAPKTRTKFSQMRFVMAFAGGLVVQAATMPMVAHFGGDNHSVIRAELQGQQEVVVSEQGRGSSRLQVAAMLPEYQEPGFFTKLGLLYGVVDEERLGRVTKAKAYNVNTESYFQDAGLPYLESSDEDAFEKIRYAVSGFGEQRIPLNKIFPAGDESLAGLDLATATISLKVINEQKGFRSAIAVFAGLAAFLFIITFTTTKERVSPSKSQRTSLRRDLLDLVTNRSWLILFALGIITLFHVCLRSGVVMYYAKYNLGNENVASLFMLTGTLTSLIATAVVLGPLEKYLGKKAGYAVLMLVTAILTFLFYFIPDSNLPLLFAVHILISFMFGPTAALIWAMYTDVADYSEWKTGRRATGLFMSACTMAQKFGYTLGGSLTMALLTYIGYQANAVQTSAALAGIKGMISWISAIPCIIGFVLILFYPLNDKNLRDVEADLQARRDVE